jgi:site-specific recombinase XerD
LPYGSHARKALEKYLGTRHPATRNPPTRGNALFLNPSGKRITERGVRNIVKLYSALLTGDFTIHPHSFRHYAASRTMPRGSKRGAQRPAECGFACIRGLEMRHSLEALD